MEESKNRLSLLQSSKNNSAGARYGARQAALGDDDYTKDTSVNTLGKLGKQDRKLKKMIREGTKAGQDMQEANQDLKNQREKLAELFFYDDELNIYINKSTGNVVYLEAKIYMRKIIMFTLIFCLFVIAVICLVSKLTG